MNCAKHLVATRQFCQMVDEDGDKIRLDDRGQIRVAMALILWQAECDVVHYCQAGFIRAGKIDMPDKRKARRLRGANHIAPSDVRATVEMFRTGYFQRWANVLELNHKIDTERLIGAGMVNGT